MRLLRGTAFALPTAIARAPPPATRVQRHACCAAMAAQRAPFRPKQSLGQNFLVDAAVASRIAASFTSSIAEVCPTARAFEVGAGTGALSTHLLEDHPALRAVELDQRAVEHLHETLPALRVERGDVLRVDWAAVARGGGCFGGAGGGELRPVAVVGNLPYNIVSQILFSILEAPPGCVALAVLMMQREVAARVTARTRTKAYGILSVVAQLYARPEVLFGVPSTAFSPRPTVESAIVRLDLAPHPELDVFNSTLTGGLRTIVRAAFQQRRKVLRNSLRTVCEGNGVELPERWATVRPEELAPETFIELTKFVFAEDLKNPVVVDRDADAARPYTVWRPPVAADGVTGGE